MAISITDLGTNSNSTGATLTLTSITVPAGSLIVVVADESTSTATAGVVTDGVNTYSQPVTGRANNTGSISCINYAANASLSAGTITYTKQTSGATANISAFYATGIATAAPLDSAVTATNFGTTQPTVTSGTPGQAGELFVGYAHYGNTSSFTQDTGHGWAAPPTAVGPLSVKIGGGNQVNSGTGTIIFAPTIGTNVNWFAAIIAFKAATAQPFAKYDWPLTVLPITAPPVSYVQGTNLSALAGAGAKPFAKYDWPLTLRPPPDRSFVEGIGFSALSTAGAKPFAKYDWPLSVLPVLNPPGYVQSIDLSPLAGAGAQPFAKYDWPGTLRPPPDRSYMGVPDLARMAGAGAKPFAKYDWPLAVLPILNPPGYVQSIDLSPLAGAGAKPFAKYDWPLSVLPVLNPPGFVESISLFQLATAGAKPFAKYDWPLSLLAVLNPPGFMQAVDLSALANAGLVPFAKYDWPLSVPPVLNPPGYTWSTSGPLIPQLGSGRRRPLFIESASGFPASYWPDGS